MTTAWVMASASASTISAEGVLEVLRQSMSQDPAARDRALRALEHWQREHCRGILLALLEILRAKDQLQRQPEARLYAAIMAKNLVGSAWDRSSSNSFGKTFAEKREWNGIDDAEKEALKGGLLCLLFAEKDSRVREQLVVLVAAVARHELPGGWPSLLAELKDVATEEAFTLEERRLALQTLKRVLVGLKGKKALLSVTSADMLRNREKLQSFVRKGAVEMESLQSSIRALVVDLHVLWRRWSGVLARGEQHWEGAGLLANAALSCVRQALLVLESYESILDQVEAFFEEALSQAVHLKDVHVGPPPGSPAAGCESSARQWRAIVGKAAMLINKCCIAAIDKHHRSFAPQVASFTSVYMETIMALDYRALQTLSQKRLVLMTRFLAKVFHNPTYKRGPALVAGTPGMVLRTPSEAYARAAEGIRKAHRYIADFWEGPVFPQFVEALITRFLVLTDDELREWEADPEGFFLVSNLELDIESEVRRCCAEALLLFLMERNIEATSRVVLSLASQAAQNQDPGALRMSEACFHAIDATALLFPVGTLDYDTFFSTDLYKYLESPSDDLVTRTMQGRVLHLLVTISPELSAESYEKALVAAIRFLQSPDLVLALYSVKLVHKLCVSDILGKGPFAEVHSALLQGHAISILTFSFSLAHRLEEGENLQMVLKLIAIEMEVVAKEANLDLIQFLAAQVPQVWQRILSLSEGENAIAGAPCQSSLINILLLLIEKTGDQCLSTPPLREVIFQLIGFCVNLGSDRASYLLEDGLKLWRCVMLHGSWQAVGQPVESSAENLFAIARSGRENHEVLCILKLYAVLCGARVVAGQEQLLAELVGHCLSDRATLKEAYSALDFLYTLGLVDAELALRVSGQAVPFLLQKLKEGELARILLEPLLEVFALFALKNESTLSGLAFGVVSELTAVLLSFKGVRGIHEFLGSAGARAAGTMKRKVAVILLALVSKYYPDLAKRHKTYIVEFGLAQAQEEAQSGGLTVEHFLDAKAGLAQPAGSDVLLRSEYYKRAAEVFARDPILNLELREVVTRTAESLVAGEREGDSVEALLGSMMGNMGLNHHHHHQGE